MGNLDNMPLFLLLVLLFFTSDFRAIGLHGLGLVVAQLTGGVGFCDWCRRLGSTRSFCN